MKPEPKKLALAILAKRKPEREPGGEDVEEAGAGLEAAAGDVIAAVEAGDSAGLAAALKDFVAMCKDRY